MNRERWFIAIFVLANVIIPLVVPDLFPFSAFPMFSGFPDRISIYEVHDEHGQAISTVPFALFDPHLFNPAPRVGQTLPPSAVPQDRLATDEEIHRAVAPVLADRFASVGYVEVHQQLFGRAGRRAALLGDRRWKIENPAR